MNKYIRLKTLNGLVSEQGTEYVYDVGDAIMVNSNEDNKTFYNFKQGKRLTVFNW